MSAGDAESSGVGGMLIATITVTVRAGHTEWSDITTECDIRAEPGWPEVAVIAASQGGLRAALLAVKAKGREIGLLGGKKDDEGGALGREGEDDEDTEAGDTDEGRDRTESVPDED